MLYKLIDFALLLSLVACVVPLKKPDDRIVGGKPVNITEYPWQVSIGAYNGHFCGGSIISRYRILTAAHCVQIYTIYPHLLRQLYARVGSSIHYTNGLVKAVRKVIVHHDYDSKTKDNDIAMIILRIPLKFTDKIQPILLPMDDDVIRVNETVVVSGWGFQQHDAIDLPSNLHSVPVHIIEQESCNRAYAQNSTHVPITENMICAGIENIGGKDACQGDSGGPMVIMNNNSTVLHGIVSWGRKCALPTHPGVYTRVSRFVDWINSV